MPRNRRLAADRTPAPAGRHRRDGMDRNCRNGPCRRYRFPSRFTSPYGKRRRIGIGGFAARHRVPWPTIAIRRPRRVFECGKRRRRRTAQRRLDCRNRHQTPVRRRIGAGLGREPAAAPRTPASPRSCVLSRSSPALQHCLGQRTEPARPHDFEMAEPGPAEELRLCRVAGERSGELLPHPLALARRIERGEIDDDPAAEPTQPQLPRDHAGRREIGSAGRALRRAGFRAAGIDIDQHRRARLVDMERPAARQGDARRERAVEHSLQIERPVADRHAARSRSPETPGAIRAAARPRRSAPVSGRSGSRSFSELAKPGAGIKPRRRIERCGCGNEPIGRGAIQPRGSRRADNQRPLAALRLAPDLHDDARPFMRRSGRATAESRAAPRRYRPAPRRDRRRDARRGRDGCCRPAGCRRARHAVRPASPSSTQAARHSPGPAAISSSRRTGRDSRGRPATAPSRTAAGRRHSNTSPRSTGSARRRGPGSRSRRPCRCHSPLAR